MKELNKLLEGLNQKISKTINLITEDVENITEETEQDVASETSLNGDLSDDEGREWSELLEYEGEVGEFNFDDKE